MAREKREAESLKQEQEAQAKAQAEAEAKAKRREAELRKQQENREKREAERKAKEAERARKEEERRKRLEEERARETERERVRKEKEEQARKHREAAKEAKEKEKREKEAKEREQHLKDSTEHQQQLDAQTQQTVLNNARSKRAYEEAHALERQRHAAAVAAVRAAGASMDPSVSPAVGADLRGRAPSSATQSPTAPSPVTPGRSTRNARPGSASFGLPARPTTTAMGPPPGLPAATATPPRGPVSPGLPRTNGASNPSAFVPRSTSASSGTGNHGVPGAAVFTTPTGPLNSSATSVVGSGVPPRTGSIGSMGSFAGAPGSGAPGLGMPPFGSFHGYDPRSAASHNLFSQGGLAPPGYLSGSTDLSGNLGGPPGSAGLGLDVPGSPISLLNGMNPSLGPDALYRAVSAGAVGSPGPSTRFIQRPSVAPIGTNAGPIRPPRRVSEETKNAPPTSPEHILGSSALLSGADEAIEPISRRSQPTPSAHIPPPPPPPPSTNGLGGMGLGASPWGPPGPAPSHRGESLLGSLGGTPIAPPSRSRSTTAASPAFPPGLVGSPSSAPGAEAPIGAVLSSSMSSSTGSTNMGMHPGVGLGSGLNDWSRSRTSVPQPPAPWDSTRLAFEHMNTGLVPGLEELGGTDLFGGFPDAFGPSLGGVGSGLMGGGGPLGPGLNHPGAYPPPHPPSSAAPQANGLSNTLANLPVGLAGLSLGSPNLGLGPTADPWAQDVGRPRD